jgi:hypothetical protein
MIISVTFLTSSDCRFYMKIPHVAFFVSNGIFWFDVLSAMNFKIRVLWDLTPYGLLDCHQRFGVILCLHIRSGTCLPNYTAAEIPGVLSPWGLNFIRWQLIFSAKFLQSLFVTYRNACQFTCTEQKGPNNSEGHRPFQNFILLVWHLLHVTILAPEIRRWL